MAQVKVKMLVDFKWKMNGKVHVFEAGESYDVPLKHAQEMHKWKKGVAKITKKDLEADDKVKEENAAALKEAEEKAAAEAEEAAAKKAEEEAAASEDESDEDESDEDVDPDEETEEEAEAKKGLFSRKKKK